MKTLAICVAALAVAAVPALGTLGSVVASFPAPANYPVALARPTCPLYLWVFTTAYPHNIYRVHTETGSVYSSYPSPRGICTRGLTYEWGGYLHLGDYFTDHVYRCWHYNGSVASSYPLNHELYGGLALQCNAGGQNPGAIFSDCNSEKMIWRQNHTNGSIYSSFDTPFSPYDLAWDYENKLVWAGDYYGDRVFGFDQNGNYVAAFSAPADYPLGLCYYGEYLWISTTIGSHWIWKVHCPAGLDGATNITPASAGKIKALFH